MIPQRTHLRGWQPIMSERIVCLVHNISDCSPLLNGCSRVIDLHAEKARDARDSTSTGLDPESFVLVVTWVDAQPGSPSLIGPFDKQDHAEEYARLNVSPPSSAQVQPLVFPYLRR